MRSTDLRRQPAARASRWWRPLIVAASAGAVAACAPDGMVSTIAPNAVQGPARGSLAAGETGGAVPGSYVVRFRDEVADAEGLARRLTSDAAGTLGFTYTAAVKGFSARLPDAAAEALRHNPNVADVEPDLTVTMDDTQLKPLSWGLDRLDQHAMPLDASYTYPTAGAGVNVYILDTGIRTTHAEFGGRAAGAYTVIGDGRGTSDCNGHGTHVAGTVAGALTGVAKAASVFAVRVLDCTGSGTSSGVIAGLDWVVKYGARPAVVNMSLSGGLSSTTNAAVANAVAAGVTVVVAAGNYTANACNYSPASEPAALTVAATDRYDNFATYSNWGSCVDLAAPGTGIRSAAIVDDTSHTQMSGTSMATPHVAGAAALYLGVNPTATPAQVAQALTGSATQNAILGTLNGSPNLLLYTSDLSTPAPSPQPTPDPTPTPEPTPDPTPTPVDQPPTASFTASCPKGNCTFDASASTDDNGILGYEWSFGDGTPAASGTSPIVTHGYTAAGSYMVTLTVTDTAGQRASTQLKVKVSRPRK